MDSQKIKILLEKYYKGESTIEEERELKKYFGKENLNDLSIAEKQLLGFFEESKVQVPSGFENELNDLIEEQFNKETKFRFLKTYRIAAAVAASIMLFIGVYLILNINEVKKPAFADTYKNPEKAYTEAQNVLMFISNTMNRKTNNLKYLSKVDYSFKQVSKISKINESINTIQK